MFVLSQKRTNRVQFQHLKVGDCFRDSDGDVCVKVNCDDMNNTLVLGSSCLYGCGDYEQVEPVVVRCSVRPMAEKMVSQKVADAYTE